MHSTPIIIGVKCVNAHVLAVKLKRLNMPFSNEGTNIRIGHGKTILGLLRGDD